MSKFINIKGFGDYDSLYAVSEIGDVKSLRSGKLLKQGINSRGYPYVCMSFKGIVRNKPVHILMANTFLGHNQENRKMVVDHIDSNKENNHISNLRIVTQRQNVSKYYKKEGEFTGVYPLGGKSSKWYASITVNNKKIHIGTYDTKYQARDAYNSFVDNLI